MMGLSFGYRKEGYNRLLEASLLPISAAEGANSIPIVIRILLLQHFRKFHRPHSRRYAHHIRVTDLDRYPVLRLSNIQKIQYNF